MREEAAVVVVLLTLLWILVLAHRNERAVIAEQDKARARRAAAIEAWDAVLSERGRLAVAPVQFSVLVDAAEFNAAMKRARQSVDSALASRRAS